MKEGWDIKKLGEVCFITMGQSPNSESYNKLGDGLPFFQGCSDFGAIHPLVTTWCNQPNKIANPNDILMSVRAPIGTLNIADSKCCIGRGLAAFTQKEGVTINKFLYYFLLSSKGDLQSKGTGATFKAIGKELIKNYAIKLPSLTEQQHIVEELDLLSSIIEKKKAQIKELDNLAQSLFYEMFGDPITNDKGWEVIRLGDKCQVSSFKRVLIEDVVNKGIPFIRGTELMTLSNGDDVNFTLFITPEHYEVVKEISGVPIIGDLLIPSINAKGNIWIVNTEQPRYYKDGRVLWVHVDSESYTSETLKFIMSLLIKKTYSVVASGATFAELKLFVLRDLRTIIPPISIQQRFSESIKGIEHQKKLIKQSIKEVETLFNSRMDYYFN